MKRILSLILALALLLSVITGCTVNAGNGDGSGDAGNGDGSGNEVEFTNLYIAQKDAEYKEIDYSQNFLYVALGKELPKKSKDAVKLRLHVGIDELVKTAYNTTGATLVVRFRNSFGDTTYTEINNILENEGIFVDYSYTRLCLTEDKLPYYTDVTVPREILPDLYDENRQTSVFYDTLYIDVIFEAPEGYYLKVKTLTVDYKRNGTTKTLTLPTALVIK